jgi:hypothetical protein
VYGRGNSHYHRCMSCNWQTVLVGNSCNTAWVQQCCNSVATSAVLHSHIWMAYRSYTFLPLFFPTALSFCRTPVRFCLLQITYEWQYKWSLRTMKRSPFFLSQYPEFASSNWCRPTTLKPGGSQGCTIPYPVPLLSLQSVSTFHLPQTQTTEGRKWTSRGTCHLPRSHPQYVVCFIVFFFFFSWLRAIGL